MNKVLNAELIDREYAYYLPLLQRRITSLSTVRAELVAKGVEQQNIDFVIRQLSRDLERFEVKEQKARNAKWGFIISGVVFALGLIITLYTYLSGASMYIVAYGAIGGGLSGMAANLAIYNSNKSSLPQTSAPNSLPLDSNQ